MVHATACYSRSVEVAIPYQQSSHLGSKSSAPPTRIFDSLLKEKLLLDGLLKE